jgi:predicted nucleic acid-binding protein
MYLLDTCVLSELWKPVPNVGLADFLGGLLDEDLFLSVITLGEIKRGIDRLPAGKRKAGLEQAYAAIRVRYASRVLAVTAAVAECWAELDVEAGLRGGHLKALDGLIAATALLSGLTVVTRNVSDFDVVPVHWRNPWT